ncbi:hypothetical protein DFH28DRAFT_922119 [Melampsora americana]|nr:hypothetical protein DFH28DRAFT_1118597 [Melampsora americana]KAH9823213.1 hypothetical protein DFH28DRAFT_922119 [Melampsora americana]
MSPHVCDMVSLWKVRNVVFEEDRDCWLCSDYYRQATTSPLAGRDHRGGGISSSNSSTTDGIDSDAGVPARHVSNSNRRNPKLLTPSSLRERQRIQAYNRQCHLDQAQRNIKKLIQNKRRDEFRTLREALYLVSTYSGPYLQNAGDKKKAALFLRRHALGGMFVHFFDDEVKWEWLQSRIL